MSSVFAHQVITDAGLALVSSASASNPIVWTMGISNATVPSDPEDKTQYTGLQAPVDAASATQNVARIVVGFSNDTGSTVAVKAVALLGKLANQDASQAVVAAYVYDADSSIELAPSEMQRTRFAFNLVFNGVSAVSVFQTGDLTIADAERFVSCHAAGNPVLGEDQVIYGSKEWDGEQIFDDPCTFMDVVMSRSIFPATTVSYNLGTTTNRWATLYANAGNFLGSIASQNLYCRDTVGGRLFEIEESGTIGACEIAGIYNDVSNEYTLDIGGGAASGSRGMLFVKPCIVTTDASTGTKTEQTVPVYLGTRPARFQGLYSVFVDTQQVISPLVAAKEYRLESSADPTVYASAVLTSNAISVSKDIAPANNDSGSIQNCGRLEYPWNTIYVRNYIVLTAGETDNHVFTILEDDGCVVFDNSLPGGDYGTFLFATNDGNTRAKVLAKEYEGFNSTISDIARQNSAQPHRIAIGALVLAIPSGWWLETEGNNNRTYYAGETITLNTSKPWFVAQQTVTPATGVVSWDGRSRQVQEYLPSGTYKLLNTLQIYSLPEGGIGSDAELPVLLQRVR